MTDLAVSGDVWKLKMFKKQKDEGEDVTEQNAWFIKKKVAFESRQLQVNGCKTK